MKIHLFSQRLSSGHNRYYQIIHASLNDTGSYRCTAENKIGSVDKEIHIDVLRKFFLKRNGFIDTCWFVSTTIDC